MNPKTKKVGIVEKIIYGSGDIGINAMYTLFSSYVLFFYTDVIGLNAAIIGTCILFSKIFDGISDLIAGQYIDTHKGKRGHCIPNPDALEHSDAHSSNTGIYGTEFKYCCKNRICNGNLQPV